MTKGLNSFPEAQRPAIANRRAKGAVRGNGFWGAIAFLDKKGLPRPGVLGAYQALNKVSERLLDEQGRKNKRSTQPQRHSSDNPRREDSRSKREGRAYKPTLSDIRERNATRVALPSVRRDVPSVGRRPEAHSPASPRQAESAADIRTAHFEPRPKRQSFKPSSGYRLGAAWPKETKT